MEEMRCTCELRKRSPASMTVGLDVVDEDLIFFRCPGTFLQPFFFAARSSHHWSGERKVRYGGSLDDLDGRSIDDRYCTVRVVDSWRNREREKGDGAKAPAQNHNAGLRGI